MAILVDWIKETVSGTPGTGAITLGGRMAGFAAFSDHPDIANGTQVYCVARDGLNWERAIYTWNTGNTLSRTTILATWTNSTFTYDNTSPAALSLSSATEIACIAISEAFNLDNLLDTVITSVGTGEILIRSGANWINNTLAEAGIEPADSTIVKTGQVNTFTRQQVTTSQSLTDGATIDWDLDLRPNAKVTIAGNRTMNAPSNIRDGNIVTLTIQQDTTGTRLISTWNAAFDFGEEGAPTLTTTASKYDVLSFMTVGTTTLRFLGIKRGFTT